jgi:transcriptional regulator with XRE-family HTH domain
MSKIVDLLRAQNITRFEFCYRARVSPTTIRAIERFDHRPRPEVCERIAAALKVPIEEIWPERGKTD